MSKISYKFQITIPKEAREKFDLNEGDRIVFIKEREKLIIAKSRVLIESYSFLKVWSFR